MIDALRDEGAVAEVWAPEGYGYVRTPAGERAYFTRTHVRAGHFHRLFVGTEVAFVRELGERGWIARDVHVVRQNARRLPFA